MPKLVSEQLYCDLGGEFSIIMFQIEQKIQDESNTWENGEPERLSYSWESERTGQVLFITSKAKKEEGERWLDNTFNYFLEDPPTNHHIQNVQHKHDKFQRYIQMGLHVKEVLEHAERPPLPCPFDPSVHMCVMYHVLGHCNGLCKRQADHRAHTEKQDQPLYEWCTNCYKSA